MTKKEALLRAAKTLFAEYGYEGATFKRISEKAGVALGLLAHHYGSKENLFLTVGLDVLDQLFDEISRECSRGGNGYERIMLFCDAYLKFTAVEENCYRLLLLCTPHSIVGTEGQGNLNSSYSRFYRLIGEFFTGGHDDGSIDADLPINTCNVIMCTLVGATRAKLLTPFASDSLYADILNVIRRLITPKP